MVIALFRMAKLVAPIVVLGLLAFTSACVKRPRPPIENSAAALVVLSPAKSNIGCGDRPNVSVSSVRDGTVEFQATCKKTGGKLNDFGESCQNLSGCYALNEVEARCTASLAYDGGNWSAENVACTTIREGRIGSCDAGGRCYKPRR